MPEFEPEGWQLLARVRNDLATLISCGPFIDTLDAEGPWWTAPAPEMEALREAIFRLHAAADKALKSMESRP